MREASWAVIHNVGLVDCSLSGSSFDIACGTAGRHGHCGVGAAVRGEQAAGTTSADTTGAETTATTVRETAATVATEDTDAQQANTISRHK
jgi:hypothetical protein